MQKFTRGDHVQIAKDLGPYMSHFKADAEAIVLYSYADKYGGSNSKSYGLHIKGHGETAWYEEHQLTLIASGQLTLLDQWKKEKEEQNAREADIDWIFSHGEEVLKRGPGASVATLAEGFGLTNLWGNHGEGFVYMQNARMTIAIARPFLEKGDKDGWLARCEEIKAAARGEKELSHAHTTG